MSTIINARSPYFKKYDAPSGYLLSVELEIRIWAGLKTSPPTAATYTITKTPLEQQVIGNYVVYEFSELIRDYIYTEYFTNAQDAVWVKLDATINYFNNTILNTTETDTFLALDGFGYFEEGSNPRTSIDPTDDSYTPMILQSNVCVQYVMDRFIRIPIFSETQPTITTNVLVTNFWQLVDEFWEAIPNEWEDSSSSIVVQDSDDSADKIYYLIIDTNNVEDGDQIVITANSGVGPSQTETITVNYICENRFDAIRAIFYNKFGALQSLWFPKKSTLTTTVKDETFNRNIIDYTTTPASYSTVKHNKKRFDVVANQSITLNTALLDECLNEPHEQLLMSEQIWLEFPTASGVEVKPVVIKTSSQQRKTGVNDKAMIQYTVDFEFAYNKINDIR